MGIEAAPSGSRPVEAADAFKYSFGQYGEGWQMPDLPAEQELLLRTQTGK